LGKVKLVRFEIASMIDSSKDVVDYLQKRGYAHLENCNDESLIKYNTEDIVNGLAGQKILVDRAVALLEKNCEIKRSLIESFTDYKTISYERYRLLSEKSEETYGRCLELLSTEQKINGNIDAHHPCYATLDYVR